ncbi:ATP-NAD kinase family protein [Chelatococcus asaccharovorans]|uniref:Putative polyphosphate/ATP-dependent NAD kinase n=1 Tax=Chelatococcus asaccharovorans TaxID=28210 RepID=A0A2V3U0P3_9HYPH|nr:NAD(+)/NADH kinase [Chelatococcus asaccharovorans]MBS7707651.1 NAD(+)/NADH kinase [Chelatococcus asaccharovorans]PXW55225.1 putative polyphosphate/ATP-dependent NAD kinase [Chelatococcus asaccharovorans]
MTPKVGIIANPISARDIRRVVASANGVQIADRANIVLRALAALAACGVAEVVMMPERGGIGGHVLRGIERARGQSAARFPRLNFLDMKITGTVEDTRCAARMMALAGDVAVIIVLGGDGTHRAVAGDCGTVPIAGISTGTNNAFPEHREPTITGLAAGLAAMGLVPPAVAFAANKTIEVSIDGGAPEIALVDVAIVTDRFVGARALWRTETFRELYVAFADPEVIGMAAIAGLVEPVTRREAGGLALILAPAATAAMRVRAPIAPGLVEMVGIQSWARMPAGTVFTPALSAGAIALDGERELFFDPHQDVAVRLVDRAFHTVDVAAVMQFAARQGLLLDRPLEGARP